MTLNALSPLFPTIRPPRSRSSEPLRSNLKVEVVELIDIDFKNYPILPNTQVRIKPECKYCLLKQKLAKPGEVAKCLAHSIECEQKEELTFSPKTPPSKPKRKPYDTDGFSLDVNESSFVPQKLISLANQISQILQRASKNINWLNYPQLIQSLVKPVKYIPHDYKPQNVLSASDTSILNQNQSSIQFELSSLQESYCKKDTEDSLRNMMSYLLKQCQLNDHIRSETLTQFIYQVELRLKSLQQTLKQSQQRNQQLTKKYTQKISTDHTIKQFEDDINFIDRFSELADMSLKSGKSVCLMCRYKAESVNEDMAHMIMAQAHTLESLIENA